MNQGSNQITQVVPNLQHVRPDIERTLRNLVAETGIDSSLVVRLARELTEARAQNHALLARQAQLTTFDQSQNVPQAPNLSTNVTQLQRTLGVALHANNELRRTLSETQTRYGHAWAEVARLKSHIAQGQVSTNTKPLVSSNNEEPKDLQARIEQLELKLANAYQRERAANDYCQRAYNINISLRSHLQALKQRVSTAPTSLPLPIVSPVQPGSVSPSIPSVGDYTRQLQQEQQHHMQPPQQQQQPCPPNQYIQRQRQQQTSPQFQSQQACIPQTPPLQINTTSSIINSMSNLYRSPVISSLSAGSENDPRLSATEWLSKASTSPVSTTQAGMSGPPATPLSNNVTSPNSVRRMTHDAQPSLDSKDRAQKLPDVTSQVIDLTLDEPKPFPTESGPSKKRRRTDEPEDVFMEPATLKDIVLPVQPDQVSGSGVTERPQTSDKTQDTNIPMTICDDEGQSLEGLQVVNTQLEAALIPDASDTCTDLLNNPEVAEFLEYTFVSREDDLSQKPCTLCSMRHEDDPDAWPTLTILINPSIKEMVAHLSAIHGEVWTAVIQGIDEEELELP